MNHPKGTEAAMEQHYDSKLTSDSKDLESPSSPNDSLAVAEDTTTVAVIDHHAERALCRKFDFRLLPVLAVMYFFNALDKGNLGNAKTNNLEKDLNFQTGQYNTILSVFYVPYVLFAPPLGMLGKKYGPHRVLPIMMFCFGSFTILSAAVQNFSGMLALRWFLGISESAFFPLVIYYLTTFYRRSELARRLAIFYAASNISNAFSGLLAYGVFQIKNSPLPNWRWLFLIEGSCTLFFSIFVWFYLPSSAATAKFLSPEEKALAFHRIQVDSSSIVNEEFNLRDAIQVFKEPVSYAFLAIEVCLGVPLQSVALFSPQIINALGYDTVTTNLYTVAPAVSGAVMLLILAFSSDFTRMRFPFIALGFTFTFVGFLVYTTATTLRVAYFATFMLTWGTSAPSVLLSTWYNNNNPHENRRIALTSVGVPLANLMGIVSANIFRNEDAQRKYLPAVITTAVFGATGAVIALSLGAYMTWDNARRDKIQGKKVKASQVSTGQLREGRKVVEWRWFL